MSFSHNELQVMDGEPRVSDVQLQELLGYAQKKNVVRLIEAHFDELEDFGVISRFEALKSGRGRPTLNYYLNEHQATAICMWANTKKARQARRQIIDVFVAWRQGTLAPRHDDESQSICRRSHHRLYTRMVRARAHNLKDTYLKKGASWVEWATL